MGDADEIEESNDEPNQTIPWVEKYRPTQFDQIVMEPINKRILQNILDTNYFPNLLLYGPPGTGKTTTIINLIQAYQERYSTKNPNLIIHLNASDDRGIDVIRNQISNFVSNKGMFSQGLKFVILDEVDYMTKSAQQAFKYLLFHNLVNVRFCLICNYISKIDEGLQDHFLNMRFNQLPVDDIFHFLKRIVTNEGLPLEDNSLRTIQTFYNSDVRSMINFIQTNQDLICHSKDPSPSGATAQSRNGKTKGGGAGAGASHGGGGNKVKKKNLYLLEYPQIVQVIDQTIWINLLDSMKNATGNVGRDNNLVCFVEKFYKLSIIYNMDIKTLLKLFLTFIIRKSGINVTSEFLISIENIIHSENINVDIYLKYIIVYCLDFLHRDHPTTEK